MDRLFVGVYPTGIAYADRARTKHGDYLRLAFLPYSTLEIEWSRGVTVPAELQALIEADAHAMQERAGQEFRVSASGQTVILAGKGDDMKRYYVAPVDNGGSLGPGRKDRTWGVFDRADRDVDGYARCVLDADTRTAARRECNERNESAGASTSPLDPPASPARPGSPECSLERAH
jgi:hypothetical protein